MSPFLTPAIKTDVKLPGSTSSAANVQDNSGSNFREVSEPVMGQKASSQEKGRGLGSKAVEKEAASVNQGRTSNSVGPDKAAIANQPLESNDDLQGDLIAINMESGLSLDESLAAIDPLMEETELTGEQHLEFSVEMGLENGALENDEQANMDELSLKAAVDDIVSTAEDSSEESEVLIANTAERQPFLADRSAQNKPFFDETRLFNGSQTQAGDVVKSLNDEVFKAGTESQGSLGLGTSLEGEVGADNLLSSEKSLGLSKNRGVALSDFSGVMSKAQLADALPLENMSRSNDSAATYMSGVQTQGQGLTNLASSPHLQIPVNISFGRPEWSNMVADRTALMFAQNNSVAELQLDPPELGPIQVKVSVHHDQASVTFTVANPAVKDAMDQTLVRLRELLSQQGLDLVNVDVSDQQHHSSQQSNAQPQEFSANEKSSGEEPLVDTSIQRVQVSYGIDSYA